MESSVDLLIEFLGKEKFMKILMYLMIHLILSELRQFLNLDVDLLCLRICPELSKVVDVIELGDEPEMVESRLGNLSISKMSGRDHKAYSFLAYGLTSFAKEDCIAAAFRASTTDNYPEESIENTLEASDRIEGRASYWSTQGEIDPAVPETLVYKLVANLCLISEIHIQPFQAYFQYGHPIYSAKAVKFHMGHLKSVESAFGREIDDMFIWTYISPEFPVDQTGNSQKFQLPKPVLCVGEILKIELLGRVQKQEIDHLYYICVSHVQVIGRPLGPAFDIDILDQSGTFTLKYYPEADYCLSD